MLLCPPPSVGRTGPKWRVRWPRRPRVRAAYVAESLSKGTLLRLLDEPQRPYPDGRTPMARLAVSRVDLLAGQSLIPAEVQARTPSLLRVRRWASRGDGHRLLRPRPVPTRLGISRQRMMCDIPIHTTGKLARSTGRRTKSVCLDFEKRISNRTRAPFSPAHRRHAATITTRGFASPGEWKTCSGPVLVVDQQT